MRKRFRRREGDRFFAFLIFTSCLLVVFLFIFRRKVERTVDVTAFYNEVVVKKVFNVYTDDELKRTELKRKTARFFYQIANGEVDRQVLWESVTLVDNILADKQVTGEEIDRLLELTGR